MVTQAEEPEGTVPTVPASVNRPGPTRLTSIVAAARRITGRDQTTRPGPGAKQTQQAPWQDDAWDMYDLVGEQRFLSSTLAGRLSQARLFAGRMPADPTEDIIPIEPTVDESGNTVEPDGNDAKAADVFTAFGGTPVRRAQIIARAGLNLFIAGDGYLAGIPRTLLNPDPEQDGITPAGRPSMRVVRDDETVEPDVLDEVAIEDFDWRFLSLSEVKQNRDGGTVALQLEESRTVEASRDDILLIRVWRPHPRRAWEADSPTRSSLPVLREIVRLTQKVGADVDSRLAGAGVFLIPQSAVRALRAAAGMPEDSNDIDPFTEALIEAMMTAVKDQSNASAKVPVTAVVPDASIEHFRHITFSTELDKEAAGLRDEAIRRLAMGQDAPPELLLGVGGMNHWGAWLVREDVVTTHLEPPLGLICDALTTQYLRPVLMQQGMTEEQANEYVVWYDVSHLILRPNAAQDAFQLHAAGAITDAALRDATGFGDADAPESADMAVLMALDMLKQAPSLAQNPGLPVLVDQLRAAMKSVEGTATSIPDSPAPDSGGQAGPPPGGPPMSAQSRALALLSDRWPSPPPEQYAARTADGPPMNLNVTVQPPEMPFSVNVEPSAPTPVVINNDIQVDPTPVNVNVEPNVPAIIVEPSRSPDVHVAAPEVTVNAPQVDVHVDPTPVHVDAPQVTVEAPNVTVEPPNVEVTAQVASPEVNVTVDPTPVNVQVPEPKKRRITTDIIRDADGQIVRTEGDEYA